MAPNFASGLWFGEYYESPTLLTRLACLIGLSYFHLLISILFLLSTSAKIHGIMAKVSGLGWKWDEKTCSNSVWVCTCRLVHTGAARKTCFVFVLQSQPDYVECSVFSLVTQAGQESHEKMGEHFNNLHKARKVKHKPTSSLLEDEDEDEEEDDEVPEWHSTFFSFFFLLSLLLLQSEFFLPSFSSFFSS